MNRRPLSSIFRSISHRCGAIAAATALLTTTAIAFDPPPIPQSSGDYSWNERQRIRFYNIPLTQKAHGALADREYEKARTLFLEILKNDPANNHARVYLIDIYDSLGEYEKGIRQAESVIQDFPDYMEPYAYKGYMLLKTDQPEKAIATFETILEKAKPSYKLRTDIARNLAEQYFLIGNMPAARKYAEQVMEDEPSAAIERLLAEIAIREEDTQSASSLLEKAAERAADPQELAELNLKRAFVEFKQDEHQKAIERAEEALDRLATDRQKQDALRIIGLSASELGQDEKAANTLKKVLELGFSETDAAAYLQALSRAGRQGEGESASAEFLERKDLSEEAQTLFLREHLFFLKNQKKYSKAYATSQKLIQRSQSVEDLREAADLAERMEAYGEGLRLMSEATHREFTYDHVLSLHFLRLKQAETMTHKTARMDLLQAGIPTLERALNELELNEDQTQALSYELAQLHRVAGDMEPYFVLMKSVVESQPESEFAYEYAVQLYGNGRLDEARKFFEASLDAPDQPERHYETCKVLADISLLKDHPEEAIAWLEKADEYGATEEDDDAQILYARADYQLENYQAVIERLLPRAGKDPVKHMYIGFSFYQTQMPGLALYHLNQVRDLDQLSGQEKQALYANRAYLNYDQDQDQAALEDIDRSLSYGKDDNMQLVKLRTLTRMGEQEQVISYGEELIEQDPNQELKRELMLLLQLHPDPAFRDSMREEINAVANVDFLAQVKEAMGLAYFQLGNNDEAIEQFDQVLELNPDLPSAYYMRGLAYYRLGEFVQAEADFLRLYDRAENFPATFWGDLGILQGDLEAYDLGTAALERSTSFYPYDIDTYEELGYQYQKAGDNRLAQQAFRQAVTIYNQVLPYLSGEDFSEYREFQKSMKMENTKLSKIWGMQAYLQRTDYDFQTLNVQELAQADSIDGVLISQAGVGITYRPPNIGFRDERELDFSLRVLANLEPNSFTPDEDSYQGGAGVLYKPLRRHNFRWGFERLFKIGDNSENNWLWRNIYTWEHGERPLPYESVWLYNRVYGEISYYLEDVERWIYYLNPRMGYSYTLNTERAVMTFPEIIGVARYQSNDPVGIGTYYYYGLGGNLRLFGRESEYAVNRWYIDLYAHYVLGRFSSLPEENEADTYFDGFIIGVNITQ